MVWRFTLFIQHRRNLIVIKKKFYASNWYWFLGCCARPVHEQSMRTPSIIMHFLEQQNTPYRQIKFALFLNHTHRCAHTELTFRTTTYYINIRFLNVFNYKLNIIETKTKAITKKKLLFLKLKQLIYYCTSKIIIFFFCSLGSFNKKLKTEKFNWIYTNKLQITVYTTFKSKAFCFFSLKVSKKKVYFIHLLLGLRSNCCTNNHTIQLQYPFLKGLQIYFGQSQFFN